MESNDAQPASQIVYFLSKIISIKATLNKQVNLRFRLATKAFHIIHRRSDIKDIPIIINNFNRLEWLQKQIDWLFRVGHTNIHIIDNLSTYPPLLKYYQKVPATVYRLDKNVGHEALWRTHIFQRLGQGYYVYTDPDVLPTKETPDDFLHYFFKTLERFPHMDKIGFGLKTDDIPDHYPMKKEVINWESSLLQQELEPGLFHSKIDTTFALYRPGAMFQRWDTTIRCGAPYQLMHMPWYENHLQLNEESEYYKRNMSSSSSWYTNVEGTDNRYDLEKKISK